MTDWPLRFREPVSDSDRGNRIMFRSNWGNASGLPVGAYVIDARPICP